MTATELAALLGLRGQYRPPRSSITVQVEILDARIVYGRVEVLVRPAAGSGEVWVGLASVAIED